MKHLRQSLYMLTLLALFALLMTGCSVEVGGDKDSAKDDKPAKTDRGSDNGSDDGDADEGDDGSDSGDDSGDSGSSGYDAEGEVDGDSNVDLEVALGEALGSTSEGSGIGGNQVDCPGDFDEPLDKDDGATITCSVTDPDGDDRDLLVTFVGGDRFTVDIDGDGGDSDEDSSSSSSDADASGSVRGAASNVDLEVALGKALGSSTKGSGIEGNPVDCPGDFDEELDIRGGRRIICTIDDPTGNTRDLVVVFTDSQGSFDLYIK